MRNENEIREMLERVKDRESQLNWWDGEAAMYLSGMMTALNWVLERGEIELPVVNDD